MSDPKVKRALVSVTDKTGVVEFCKTLVEEFGVEIVSTGGTAKALEAAGVKVRPIDDLTGFPEMMDGRVKTLHPRVHGGLLARRDMPTHMEAAREHGIGMIDMVCVNLYAFEATVARVGVTEAEAIENIDIGGPSMLRSAAKNFASVAVVTEPSSYDDILSEMRANEGATTLATRRQLAEDVFKKTSSYDTAIWHYLANEGDIDRLDNTIDVRLTKKQNLRYGENPHQTAGFYVNQNNFEHTLAHAEQIQGKDLSYNNILDTDSAWSACREFTEGPCCVIVKHTNPCGISVAGDIVTAYKRAHECDPISAYGGVMAFNRTVTTELVRAILDNKQFVEVMVAPDYEPEAIEMITAKPNIRVLKTGGVNAPGGYREMRAVEGGVLVQNADAVTEDPAQFTVPTKRKPTDEEFAELLFAWKAAKCVKSNSIVLTKNHTTVGVGAGQMNRVNSAKIACEQAGSKAQGSVAGSDAFMPFSDSLEEVAAGGATAVIQPGGSIRDDEVIAKADELGIALVFTGHRHFRH